MDFATLMQFMAGAPSAPAAPMGAAPAPPSPAEAIGRELDVAKAAIPSRDRRGRYQYVRGGRWGAAQVIKADNLQRQYEDALGNPGAVQNDPRLVPELGGWGAVP